MTYSNLQHLPMPREDESLRAYCDTLSKRAVINIARANVHEDETIYQLMRHITLALMDAAHNYASVCLDEAIQGELEDAYNALEVHMAVYNAAITILQRLD